MPKVGAEEELRTLMECQYRYPAETLQDLQVVRSRFSDLRLHVDFYCFPNQERRRLLLLAGTLPIHYEGNRYNIPVCIWLHQTHPASRPRCYVCPSVSMAINPACPWVDARGNVSLDGLRTWTHGSSLALLLAEMQLAFQEDTPLYATWPPQTTPPQTPPQKAERTQKPSSSPSSPSSCHVTGHKASQLEQAWRGRSSYMEELLGIDFSPPPPPSSRNLFLSSSSPSDVPITDSMDRMMAVLRLDGESSGDQLGSPVAQSNPQEPASGPPPGPRLSQIAARLSPDQATVFRSLMTMEERKFNPAEVLEAVQLNRDLQSALKFLSHTCPICHDQVSFSKIITMTHCSCFLCRSCFTSFFSVAIRERSVDQLVCPQCAQPEVIGRWGLDESMDYFNLLDTQIRHFLPPHIHELFQRKLRDRTLRGMPTFCWCAHCSFGILHEVDRLRMDCPSCKKSTCSQCRSAWAPQHQELSCQQFQVWQQQQNQISSSLLKASIECPRCRSVFSLCRGGCLHFTCSQCGHQFCGSCRRRFALGSACGFSAECSTRGLHAHHPRDCLYHLRDWPVPRLHLLLQHYRVPPSWMEAANGSPADASQTGCPVLELKDGGGEEPCGRPALPEHGGCCQSHYKERLVELINRCHADPVVLFSEAEMEAELQRWHVAVPTRKPDEPEPLRTHRLRLVVTNSIPLRKPRPLSDDQSDDSIPHSKSGDLTTPTINAVTSQGRSQRLAPSSSL